MYIKRITAKGFRNYQALCVDFSPTINFILGNNGSGKTNIIEAVSLLSVLRSFRNASDSDMIRWGDSSYFCSGEIAGSVNSLFEIGCSNEAGKIRKKVKIDGHEVKKASDFFGKFLAVVFLPSDINLINGSPDLRRRFFDSVISKVDPPYIELLNSFKKILISRNRLLKSIREKSSSNFNELDIWDQMFADKASKIINKRAAFIENFNQVFIESYLSISENDSPPVIEYANSTDNSDYSDILSTLQNVRRKDIAISSTSFGPQRDDYLLMKSNAISFDSYASQGQRRTAAISLKIAESEIIEKTYSEKSVLLVDDIFSELDKKRKNNMVRLLSGGNQVIFTMVSDSGLDQEVFSNVKKFYIDENLTTYQK